MKWRKRQREIKRLRAAHAGKQWRAPFPDLKEGLRPLPPCSNILELYANADPSTHPKLSPPTRAVSAPANPPGLIVDHFHKSGLQVILKSELPWAGGKKP